MKERIAVVGLGYVGLPLALALARKFKDTIGFDINSDKVREIQQKLADRTRSPFALHVTDDLIDLKGTTFFIVTVPTPIDENHCPNLQPLISASQAVGQVLQRGSVVVYESTVYPGVTEEVCAPILEQASGLRWGIDFKVGYSPERVNPGDRKHTLEKIVKLVAAEDGETLERVATVYDTVIEAGIYRVSSIKVAEAAKVIENIQRDLNIALMNEFAIIFDLLNIRTQEVLAAASTKWNFVPFKPGLVGGHCIGVDPYYLAAKAEQVGHYPEVILAGRRINDGMGQYLGQRLVQLFANHRDIPVKQAKVGILGITFKENVADIRNSRVPDVVRYVQSFGMNVLIHDPIADAKAVKQEYGLELSNWDQLTDLDVLVLAVTHPQYLEMSLDRLLDRLTPGGIFMDVKSAFEPESIPTGFVYWSL
jgi:UDP-N-acetyl-D-galactosamine dehydrogenase